MAVTPTVRLGRIAGISIGANWTWIVVVALLTWSLGADVFPETNPGLSDGTYLAMAAIAVPVFFGCLLLHELGHALRAQREGMEIEGISLWIFGGVARFRGAFPSAGAELRIALAGPAVSLALGVLFLGVALAAPLPSAIDGVVHWLGYINLTLLAFNMLPALPLDGGRVLRATLWRIKGEFLAATRAAAALGRAFGQVLIVGGVVLALVGPGIGGLWLAFIGWFLLIAAEAELGAAVQHEALAGMVVADAMVRHPVTVPEDLTIDRFVDEIMLVHRHAVYPVIGAGGRPLGLVAFREAVGTPRASWATERVRDHLHAAEDTPCVGPGDLLEDVWPDLAASRLRRALVVDGDQLAGLLTASDVRRILELSPVRPRTPPPSRRSVAEPATPK